MVTRSLGKDLVSDTGNSKRSTHHDAEHTRRRFHGTDSRALRRGETTGQGADQNVESCRVGRSCRGASAAPGRNGKPCATAGADFRTMRRKAESEAVQGDPRIDRGFEDGTEGQERDAGSGDYRIGAEGRALRNRRLWERANAGREVRE